MTTFFRNHFTLISVVLLLAVLPSVWLFPSAASILGIILLLLSLGITGFFVTGKHREAYLQGKTTRTVFARHVLIETVGILLAMAFAGLLGQSIARIATGQIAHELTRLIASVLIGLLIGMSVGIFVKRTWDRFVKLSPAN